MEFPTELVSRTEVPAVPPAIIEPEHAPHISGYRPVEPDSFLETLWRILQKRKWVIITSTVVVFTLALIMSFRMTKLYGAHTQISINKQSSDDLGLQESRSSSEDYWDYTVEVETQTKILQSDALALQVIRDLQLDSDPAFTPNPRNQDKTHGSIDASNGDTTDITELVGRFKGGLRVTPVPRTRIIDIYYLSPDPKLSAKVANGVANAFIEQNVRAKFESTMQTSDWISRQVSDLRLKVETAQEKLVRYQKEHGILGIDEKQNIITSKLDELNRQLTTAETERIHKEASYRLSTSGDAELVAKTEPNSVIDKLNSDRAALRTKYAELSTNFGPAYPKVAELKSQIDELDRQIRQENQKIGVRLKNEYLAATQREKMLRSALESQKREANQLNESAIEYNILKRDVETSRELYEGLLQRLKEAGVTAGLKSNNIRIIDAARPPLVPSSPNIPRNLILGILVGIAGGVMLAFVQESLDNTVRTPDQVEAISLLPTIGVIPAETGNTSQARKRLIAKTATVSEHAEVALVVSRRPHSEMAESYRALRTSILLSSLGAPPKVLMVTSALPQEGKTTTAINCATVLAQRGSRVLLVDADLRRPRIGQTLGVDCSLGLSNLLTGSAAMKEVIQAAPDVPLLSVIPAGPVPPQPAELLGSDLMKSYITQWRDQFDHVVIDTPPALSVTDPIIVSVMADSVVLVIRSGKTRKEALRRVRDKLRMVNARIIGVVVNGVNLQSPDHYYYYYGTKYGNTGYYSKARAESEEA
ncbi:MAG TPA: polysaccharide biosynthesis tyrosine autokinase [Terriglobales bacterium]|nr:polysaccharide biosynthesis tyrosine autokinase [Terriglobales bacterium]